MTTEPAVEYQNSGRIIVRDGDKTYRLRPPRLGEFWDIEDAWNEVVDVNAEHVERFRDDNPQTAEEKATQRKSARESLRNVLSQKQKTLGLIFEKLSDNQLPADAGTWPTWLVLDPEVMGKFIDHWRTVPLAHGWQ